MHRRVVSCFLLTLLTAIFFLSGCHTETEADRIKKVITSVQHAAEEKKIMTILDQLSRSYRDAQGYDYDGIKGLLAFYFYRHQKVRVYIPSLEATVNGSDAAASFEAVLAGAAPEKASGTPLPGALGVYRFTVDLRQEGGGWKVVSAKWERIGDQPEGLLLQNRP